MMRKISINLIVILFLSISIPCLSQEEIFIPKIDAEGNRHFSKKEIQQIIPPGRYSNEQLKKAILQLLEQYQKKGFYFTRIETENDSAHLLLSISEGSQLTIEKIAITRCDSLIKNQVQSLLDIRQKDSVVETINLNAEQILEYLENHGYPFSQLTVDSLIVVPGEDRTTTRLECYLELDPGPQVTIDSILVQGNHLTRRQVIVRESRLKPGEIYDHNKIERVRQRLVKTGLFNQVDEPKIWLDRQGRGYLMISLNEGNPNQLNAVLGYNPATNNREKGYITGLIDIAFKNLLGTARVIEAFWQKKDRSSQELRFHYVEPWVAGYPINIGGGFQQAIQDTSFIRRNMLLELEFPFSDILTIQSQVGTEDVLPDSIGQLLYQLPRSNSYLARVGFTYDTRNNHWNPSRGIRYQTQFEYAHKRVSPAPFLRENLIPTGKFRRDRWLVDVELYIPTFKWQTILFGLHGRQVKSTEKSISVSDLYRFGGTTSLRGYREEEFLGEKIAWLNLEYRYLLAARSRVFLFWDSGYFLHQYPDQKILKGYKFGYGFGLRIDTRLGIIGIDYGLGEGRGLTNGLVHVGLINNF